MNIEMTLVTCASCYVAYAIPDEMIGRLRKCHNTFYCPNGHANVFNGKSEEEKLREQLQGKEKEVEAKRDFIDRLQTEIISLKKPARKSKPKSK